MNKCTFVGRLIADPVTREAGGVPVCSMTLSVRTRGKDDSGYPKSVLIKATAWRKLAEMVTKFGCVKGSMLAVNGMIDLEEYTSRDGSIRHQIVMDVDDIDFLLTANSAQQPGNAPASPSTPPVATDAPIPVETSECPF